MWRRDLIDFADPELIVAASAAYASLRNCVLDAQTAGWNTGSDPDLLAATVLGVGPRCHAVCGRKARSRAPSAVSISTIVIRQGLLALAITH